MCAIIGAILQKPTESDWENIKSALLESSIRGLHATGASFLLHWNEGITTFIEPVPAEKFIKIHLDKSVKEFVNEDGNLYMIGHCRYSTSDLEYNQPLFNDQYSIAHNGVLSQEMPERWKDLYGYDTKTKNDSELVLQCITANKSPLEEFPDSSMAVAELHRTKTLRFYRNGKRPIYFTHMPNGYIITSTEDIGFRSRLKPTPMPMSTYMTVSSDLTVNMKRVRSKNPDLQNA